MSQSAGLSARSFLIAGVSAAMVGAAVLTPVTASQPAAALAPALRIASPEVQLTAGGDTILAAYTAIQPWVAYGFELADYALSFVPVLWWVAPAVDLAYFTAQPIVESLVYSFAFLLDGNYTAIGPTVTLGLQTAVQNFIEYSIAWVYSIVPLPPLPPIPIFPGAAAATRAVTVRTAGHIATAAATEAETPAVAEAPAETPAVTEAPAETPAVAEASADTPAVAEASADTPALAEALAVTAPTTAVAPSSRRDGARLGARAPRSAAPTAAATTDGPQTEKSAARKARRAA